MKITLTMITLWVLSLGASAQMVSVTAEVDTVFGGPSDIDPTGELEGYTSYLIYANFTNPTLDSSSALGTAGTGGVPRPMDPTHGTVSWTSTTRMSTAAAAINGTAFLFVAFGMPSERRTVQKDKA